MPSRERRYSKYKSEDVWATLYEQQQAVATAKGMDLLHRLSDWIVLDGTVTGNCVLLTRPSTTTTYKTIVLARSSDWYAYSLNCQDRWKHGVEAIACGTHDSCVPVPVLAIDQLRWYEPDQMRIESLHPRSFDEQGYVNDQFDVFRRSRYGHNMLIGALMRGRADAIERLKAMRPSTRFRIEAKLKKLHQRRQGKPLAV